MSDKIGVIGSGAWGTALAHVIATAGQEITLWSFESEVADEINTNRSNMMYLDGITVHRRVKATTNIEEAAQDAKALVLVPPAQFMYQTLEPLKKKIDPSAMLIIASKGIDIKSGKLLSDVLADLFPKNPIGVLTGPSFAIEAAKGLPTVVTLAVQEKHRALGEELIQDFAHERFRPYVSFDPIGAQVGGAIKNVIAIASGIAQGMGLGDNARSALITRGLIEITALGVALGGKAETFRGLSGLGDLVLTCSAMQSRNFSLGFKIGKGEKIDDILRKRHSVSEGVYTVEAAVALSKKYNVLMPITHAVYDVIKGAMSPEEAVAGLMTRPLGEE